MVLKTIVEIPQGSQNKYEYDAAAGRIRLDRVLSTSMHYPANYGFIPETWAEDNDPLDVLIFGSGALFPGVVADVRVLGVLMMTDEHGPDAKIVGVIDTDPRSRHVTSINDLGAHCLKETRHFFEQYKVLQGLSTDVGAYHGTLEAEQLIEAARKRFQRRQQRGHEGHADGRGVGRPSRLS